VNTIKPTKIQSYSRREETFTAVEMGKLWATYTGNTMARQVLLYFLQHVEDEDIKKIVEQALKLCETIIQESKDIIAGENMAVPIGFSEEDANLGAPRLFADEFYLHYLKYAGKAGLSIYSIAIPIMMREDVRQFFVRTLDATVKLLFQVNNALMTKGYLSKAPVLPIPDKVDFIKKQSYLHGFIGNVRPLHSLEVTHLYDNIENNVTSKALLIGFSQTAKTEAVRQFMLRGKEITGKQVELMSQHLHHDNLPSLPLLDHLVSTSTFAPFSDKLMLAHKIDMFSMKIRSFANASSLNGRRDLGALYGKFIINVSLYVEDGANIMIDTGWMEQPPEAADRNKLASE
jgi:hypothetical protein